MTDRHVYFLFSFFLSLFETPKPHTHAQARCVVAPSGGGAAAAGGGAALGGGGVDMCMEVRKEKRAYFNKFLRGHSGHVCD
jgi:hypothetical protein